ncbi:hypothetical protein ACOMHN_055377 [Nucella lapillus]
MVARPGSFVMLQSSPLPALLFFPDSRSLLEMEILCPSQSSLLSGHQGPQVGKKSAGNAEEEISSLGACCASSPKLLDELWNGCQISSLRYQMTDMMELAFLMALPFFAIFHKLCKLDL